MMEKQKWKTTPGGNPQGKSFTTSGASRLEDSGEPGLACERQNRTKQNKTRKSNNTFSCATWNVRSLLEGGKMQNLFKEMTRLKIDILGISEHRWPDSGCVNQEDVRMFYSGHPKSGKNGVAIIVGKKFTNCEISTAAISDRIIAINIRGLKQNVNIVQVYAPTADKSDEEIESFYNDLHSITRTLKKEDMNLIMGDFNAKVGSSRIDGVTGGFGLGETNERGMTLIDFCRAEEFTIKNTFYKLHPRRLYTWKSPQDAEGRIVRNQIDYLLINKRFQNSMTRAAAYPGADIGSDHNPVIGTIKTKFHRTKPKIIMGVRFDTEKLKNLKFKEEVMKEMVNNMPPIEEIQERSTNESWERVRNAAIQVATTKIGTCKKQKSKPWMTEDILMKMEERRIQKVHHKNVEYQQIHKEIRKMVREAKSKWIEEQCTEAQEMLRLHDSHSFHKKIKTITRSFKKQNLTALRDEDNRIILEPEKMVKHWENYISSLFRDKRDTSRNQIETESGPRILQSEVEYALKIAKNRKAPGGDNLPTEILKCIDPKTLTALFNEIYSSGQIPDEWLKSTFVPLPKKANAKTCSEFRLISLMSHALKTFLRIIHNRIYRICEEHCGETQFGFKKGMGTREALFGMKILLQRCYDYQQEIHICFIDYEKAFDTVKHDPLITILREIGLDGKDIRIIQQLYWNQRAEVKINKNLKTESVEIRKGVRQGCILSPLLFNLYLDKIFRSIQDSELFGIKVNGVKIWNLRYADDTALFASSVAELQKILTEIDKAGQQFGVKINAKKTKWMSIERTPGQNGPLIINGSKIEKVTKFKYLGSMINSKLDCDEETKIRCGIAKETFRKLRNVLIYTDMPLHLKIRVVQCYVIPVLLYGAETWSIKAVSIRRLEAIEMWFLRRLLKVPWIEKVSNDEVLRRAGVDRELMGTIKRRKISYLGHIVRGKKYEFLQLILEGRIEGKRPPGRTKQSWSQNIKTWTGINNFEELVQEARERRL